MTLTDSIRTLLIERGDSVRRVHLQTGIQRATLRKFLDGGGVYSETLDKLAEYLELQIIPKAPPSKPAKGKR